MELKEDLANAGIDLNAIDSIDELSEEQKTRLAELASLSEYEKEIDEVTFLTRKVKMDLCKEWDAQNLDLRQRRLRRDALETCLLLEEVRSAEAMFKCGRIR